MTTFYRVDGSRLTYAEYWRLAPNPFVFLIAAGLKTIGLPMQFNFAIPRPDRLFLVGFDELPAEARYAMRPHVRKAESSGLALAFFHRLAVPERHRLGAAGVFLDEPGTSAVSVMFSKDRAMTQTELSIASRFADDSLGVTTTVKKTMEPVPDAHVERHTGADVPTLLDMHREHLARLEGEGLVPVPLKPERLEQFVLDCEHRYVDFHVSRGLFVPMTDDEVDALCDPED